MSVDETPQNPEKFRLIDPYVRDYEKAREYVLSFSKPRYKHVSHREYEKYVFMGGSLKHPVRMSLIWNHDPEFFRLNIHDGRFITRYEIDEDTYVEKIIELLQEVRDRLVRNITSRFDWEISILSTNTPSMLRQRRKERTEQEQEIGICDRCPTQIPSNRLVPLGDDLLCPACFDKANKTIQTESQEIDV